MKVYIVLEDVGEAYIYNVDRVFLDIFLNEDDAKAKVKELSRSYNGIPNNDIYYEEIEIKWTFTRRLKYELLRSFI